jgi:toxin-antitoxin system PIN domain toxin
VESDRHAEYRQWLESVWTSRANYAVSDLVLSGCLRVLTHPKVFDPPTPTKTAIAFVNQVRSQPNAVVVSPEHRHWPIFTELCRKAAAVGNLIPDAYLAALAIESGSELITTDRDFARFPGLKWRHPFD